MKKYEYEVVSIKYSIWTGRAKEDYLQVINEYGQNGWRFVGFAPINMKPKGTKGIELVFEKEL
ncbi:MAG: DUF4177 domain-containing protein [Saprospiraceae bacterium]|nr:DUF4177 domain-containing protein [Bacteroidia bacterium]NNE13980.1 DUF4177 domain-containing protein [Saprospiraceae bacterium]NNL92760.1 DUF4177 domain-containing protein [Saprospiraceae bacterium]